MLNQLKKINTRFCAVPVEMNEVNKEFLGKIIPYKSFLDKDKKGFLLFEGFEKQQDLDFIYNLAYKFNSKGFVFNDGEELLLCETFGENKTLLQHTNLEYSPDNIVDLMKNYIDFGDLNFNQYIPNKNTGSPFMNGMYVSNYFNKIETISSDYYVPVEFIDNVFAEIFSDSKCLGFENIKVQNIGDWSKGIKEEFNVYLVPGIVHYHVRDKKILWDPKKIKFSIKVVYDDEKIYTFDSFKDSNYLDNVKYKVYVENITDTEESFSDKLLKNDLL